MEGLGKQTISDQTFIVGILLIMGPTYTFRLMHVHRRFMHRACIAIRLGKVRASQPLASNYINKVRGARIIS